MRIKINIALSFTTSIHEKLWNIYLSKKIVFTVLQLCKNMVTRLCAFVYKYWSVKLLKLPIPCWHKIHKKV